MAETNRFELVRARIKYALQSRRVRQAAIGACVLGCVLLAALAYAYYAPRGHKQFVTVLIPPGSSVPTIGRVLRDADLIRFPILVRVFTRLRGDAHRLQAGEFEIPPRISLRDMLDLLRDGKPVLHAITVAEGLTSAQIVKALEASDVLIGAISQTPLEGSLLPETYMVVRGTKRDTVIADMQRAMAQTLAHAWAQRQADLPIATQREALVLASIVEKETGLPDERRDVAAVFVNRLRLGMKLQSDPTIIYGLVGGQGKLGRPIRLSEIRKPSAYNTYVIEGLPPTPIANPGRAAIEAVMNPSDSKAIFFVADGTGGHAFAQTLRAHNRNVRKWRAIEKKRNAKKSEQANE